MSRAEYQLFNNLCGIYHVLLQSALFLVLWITFFGSERKKRMAAATGILAAVNLLVYLWPTVPYWGRYAVSAAMVAGYCRIRYKGQMGKAVFTLLLFYNFHGISFLISNSVYQFIMDEMQSRLNIESADYMLHMYKDQVIGQSLNLLVYTLSFLIMTGLIKKIVKHPFDMSRYDVTFLSALNVVGSLFTRMVLDISAVRIDREVFFLFTECKEMLWKIPVIAVLICGGEISAVYIFWKYKQLQGEREKHFVEEQQMKAMKRRLEEAENFYGGIRKVRHEMKNHMVNIKGLVAGKKYGEVERYIEKLDETIQVFDHKFHTGNAVTDVIINDKYQRAEKSGILFGVKFEYRDTDTISAFDMGILLNNLLDNAIEACEKPEVTKPYISLSLKRKNHFLLIEVENSFNGKAEWKEGEAVLVTTKENSLPDILMEHGIGLKNVRDVADRYLGFMDIKTEKNLFKVTVMLQQKESKQIGTEDLGKWM